MRSQWYVNLAYLMLRPNQDDSTEVFTFEHPLLELPEHLLIAIFIALWQIRRVIVLIWPLKFVD